MSGSSSYINAAHSVLWMHRKPMHYQAITTLALKLGLLETTSSNCEVAMSSILSKDIRENSLSFFAKVSPGIYKLKSSSHSSFPVPKRYATQIRNLQSQLGAINRKVVLRKALFLLQQSCTQAKYARAITLKHAGKSVEIDFHQLIKDARKENGAVPEQFDHDFVIGIEAVKQKLSLPSAACALMAGLDLLQHAATLGISGKRICTVEVSRC